MFPCENRNRRHLDVWFISVEFMALDGGFRGNRKDVSNPDVSGLWTPRRAENTDSHAYTHTHTQKRRNTHGTHRGCNIYTRHRLDYMQLVRGCWPFKSVNEKRCRSSEPNQWTASHRKLRRVQTCFTTALQRHFR